MFCETIIIDIARSSLFTEFVDIGSQNGQVLAAVRKADL